MSLRTNRVASLIKDEVGMLLSRDFRDATVGLITVTDVHVTPDLRIAKIYVSILGNSKVREDTMKTLEERKGEIRSFLGSHIRLKFTPAVQFHLDETLDKAEKINRLIREIHKSDGSDPS